MENTELSLARLREGGQRGAIPLHLTLASDPMKTNPAITEIPVPTRPAHTPGPWEVGGKVGLYCDDVQITSNKEPVAIAVTRRSYDILSRARRSPAELAANARLIASAPELLEALERISTAYDETLRHPIAAPLLQAIYAARAAIAKARG